MLRKFTSAARNFLGEFCKTAPQREEYIPKDNPTTLIQRVTPDVPAPKERPSPDKIFSGNPVFPMWNLEDKGGFYCGVWQSTAGKWPVTTSVGGR